MKIPPPKPTPTREIEVEIEIEIEDEPGTVRCSDECPGNFRNVMDIDDREERAYQARICDFRGYWLDRATSGDGFNAQLNRIALAEDGYF